MTRQIFLCALVSAFVLWAICAVLDVGGQRSMFMEGENVLLCDYWMPRTCADEGYAEKGDVFPMWLDDKRSGWVDGKMRVSANDRCYPALALLPLKAFPATWGGAWVWSILTALALGGVLCVISKSWWPLVLLGSMPVISNVECGNQAAVAAALVGIFLAWYRSEVRWQRVLAALAISAAVCFKVSPVLLGALYLHEKDWKGIGLCVVFTGVLFLVPFFFLPDGIAGVPLMVENAQANALRFSRTAEFGLVEFWRTIRVSLHQDCTRFWPGCLVAVRISQALGFAMVAWGAWKRNLLLVVVGMLWAAGNMHYYGALYLLPVFVLTQRRTFPNAPSAVSLVSAILWFVILCPFQFVVMGHGANGVLCNLAALVLCLLQLCGETEKGGNG